MLCAIMKYIAYIVNHVPLGTGFTVIEGLMTSRLHLFPAILIFLKIYIGFIIKQALPWNGALFRQVPKVRSEI